MNIVVLLRAIQDPAGLTVNRRAQKVFVNQRRVIFNPADRNALEAALDLGGTVSVLAAGGAGAEQVLRDARTLGAARAIWIKERGLERADGLALTRVFQRALERLDPADLVLCGQSVLDADLGQIGPRLAQALGRPFIGRACQVRVEADEVRVAVARGAAFQTLAASLPAVVAVERDANQPRFARGANIITIYRDQAAVESLSLADLDLSTADLQPGAEFRAEAFPPEREFGRRVEGGLEEQARAVAETLKVYL